MSSDPSGRKGYRRIAPSSVRVRALHPPPQAHRHSVHGFGPRHDARGYPMRDDRLEVSVIFDERRGYAASAPELRQPVTALSLGGLRRRIEALLVPDDIHIVLHLDRTARRE